VLAEHQPCQGWLACLKQLWYEAGLIDQNCLLLCSCLPVVDGWLDLAKLVASEGSKNKSPYDDLAYKIGK
jgi:hypothetical protein